MQSNCKMDNYNNNSDLEKEFNPVLDEILRKHFDVYQLLYFYEDDIKNASDITIVTNDFDVYAVGKRVRGYEYYIDYKYEFTIRDYELEKIFNDKADYFLYAFINKEHTDIKKYFLIDYAEFRKEYTDAKATPHWNPDGTKFYSFRDYQFKKSIIFIFGE